VTENRAPGVYVEELGAQSHPIAGVATSTAGFIGEAAAGPIEEAELVTSFTDFDRAFGGLEPDAELGYAVMAYFANGGREAWVVRVHRADDVTTGLAALEAVDPLNVLCIPGVVDADPLLAAVSWCQRRRAFLVVDPPGAEPERTIELVGRLRGHGSANAAVYFPRLVISDPFGGHVPRVCAPGGWVAGLMARTDIERGVWHAPAGTEASLVGVSDVEVAVPDDEAARLGTAGVNPIRQITDHGVVVWGARTVSDDDVWKYVPVRRLALFLEESLRRGLEWAVFEPNDEAQWVRVHQSIASFLRDLWQAGALQGTSEDEAFLIRRERARLSGNGLDHGRLNILVGVAPIRSAEFVLFRIGVWTQRPP
jgi:Bacteriophage tail sheath protein